MTALRGWSNSSDVGIRHPLRRAYVNYFTDADTAKSRLERLASENVQPEEIRIAAQKLLEDWTDEAFG